jgi:hypothetical protein
MTYALNTTELTGSDITVGDCKISYSAILSMTDDQRAAYGIQPITDNAIPIGKVSTASHIVVESGKAIRKWTLADAPPPPVPETISDRQFAQVLAIDGLITQAEALAWVKGGTVPASIQSVVDGIADASAKFGAQMLLSGATSFNRSHPMVTQLGTSLGMTPAQIDDIWRYGATL